MRAHVEMETYVSKCKECYRGEGEWTVGVIRIETGSSVPPPKGLPAIKR